MQCIVPDPITRFFCPTEADRERLHDLEASLRNPRVASFAAIGLTLVALGPWLGWWPLPLCAALTLVYEGLLRQRLQRSGHAALLVFSGFLLTSSMIAGAAILTGGPASPLLPWLVIPIVSLAGRFDTRGVWTGTGFAVVILAIVAAIDAHGFADDPTPVFAMLPLVLAVNLFSVAMMRAERRQRTESSLDPLTGLLNRKSLEGRFAELAEQASVTGDPVALLALDVDHFKTINDTHGHARGDIVLRAIAAAIREQLRSFELAYRLGGEEFLVVLPGVDLKRGAEVAERLRRGLETLRPDDLPITVSVGVSAGRGQAVAFDALYREADAALYAAKAGGRNRVQVAPNEPDLSLAA
jgi:diguanylate cyclase (GGDEF)-like protein